MSPPAFSPELCRVFAAKLASPKPKLAPPRTRVRTMSGKAASATRKQLRNLAFGEATFGKRGAEEEKDKPRNEENLVAFAKPRLLLVLLHQRNLA